MQAAKACTATHSLFPGRMEERIGKIRVPELIVWDSLLGKAKVTMHSHISLHLVLISRLLVQTPFHLCYHSRPCWRVCSNLYRAWLQVVWNIPLSTLRHYPGHVPNQRLMHTQFFTGRAAQEIWKSLDLCEHCSATSKCISMLSQLFSSQIQNTASWEPLQRKVTLSNNTS